MIKVIEIPMQRRVMSVDNSASYALMVAERYQQLGNALNAGGILVGEPWRRAEHASDALATEWMTYVIQMPEKPPAIEGMLEVDGAFLSRDFLNRLFDYGLDINDVRSVFGASGDMASLLNRWLKDTTYDFNRWFDGELAAQNKKA